MRDKEGGYSSKRDEREIENVERERERVRERSVGRSNENETAEEIGRVRYVRENAREADRDKAWLKQRDRNRQGTHWKPPAW